jgi:hypothetical protein
MELDALPYGLSQTPGVQRVAAWYRESFRDLVTMSEPRSVGEELEFTRVLERIYERHHGVVPMMAAGVLQMKKRLGASLSTTSILHIADQCPYLFEFLNKVKGINNTAPYASPHWLLCPLSSPLTLCSVLFCCLLFSSTSVAWVSVS